MDKSHASPVQSPVLTPQAQTPDITTPYSSKLWDERPIKYSQNVIWRVCLFIFILVACEEIASYTIAQSLKNFFQKLGWSNKGSNAMKLTYDSLSQFACIIGGYLADEKIGKFRTLTGAVTMDIVGFLILMVAALPSVVSHVGTSKVIFNIGLFLFVAFSQIVLRSTTLSFGGDQFAPSTTHEEKAVFFSGHYWVANFAAFVGYVVFPTVSIHGLGAIPAEYGYFSVYFVGLVLLVIFALVQFATRARYVDVPPTKSLISVLVKLMLNQAKENFRAKMIMIATVFYVMGFLLNILASFSADYGSISKDLSYVCGALITVATILWVYFGRDASFLDTASSRNGGSFDAETVNGVKLVIRLLPLNAFNVIWWVCQNQRGNNQSIIQQTDVRLGSGPFGRQIPGPTVQMFNPISAMILVPLLQKVVYPFYEKRTGRPASRFGKILTGYLVAALAMFWTGVYEVIRRSTSPLTYVDSGGVTKFILNEDGHQVMNDIPWWTALPQYFLVALAGALIVIPTYDICYSEVPQSMRGTSIALCFFVTSMGSTLMSVIVLLFGKYIPPNLNNGHMEYMYYTIGAVTVVSALFFFVVMKQTGLSMNSAASKDEQNTEDGAF